MWGALLPNFFPITDVSDPCPPEGSTDLHQRVIGVVIPCEYKVVLCACRWHGFWCGTKEERAYITLSSVPTGQIYFGRNGYIRPSRLLEFKMVRTRRAAATKIQRFFRAARARRAKAVSRYRTYRPIRRSGARGINGFHVHMYKRWGPTDEWVIDGNGNQSFFTTSKTFSLSAVTEHAELTQLYDQYKIMAVVVKVHLLNNPDSIYAPGVDGATGPFKNPTHYPKLWFYRDYDDNVAPADRTTIKQIARAKCFTMRPTKTYSFKVKPAILNLLSGTTTAPIWNQRLDCTSATQTHYGMKFALDYEMTPPLTGTTVKVVFETLYYLKMYNSR